MWHVLKVKLDFVNVTRLFQNVNKHVGVQKAVEFSPTWMALGHHYQAAASIRVWLMCNLSVEKARCLFECGFLIKYGFHT